MLLIDHDGCAFCWRIRMLNPSCRTAGLHLIGCYLLCTLDINCVDVLRVAVLYTILIAKAGKLMALSPQYFSSSTRDMLNNEVERKRRRRRRRRWGEEVVANETEQEDELLPSSVPIDEWRRVESRVTTLNRPPENGTMQFSAEFSRLEPFITYVY